MCSLFIARAKPFTEATFLKVEGFYQQNGAWILFDPHRCV